jgi:hypothetical protein
MPGNLLCPILHEQSNEESLGSEQTCSCCCSKERYSRAEKRNFAQLSTCLCVTKECKYLSPVWKAELQTATWNRRSGDIRACDIPWAWSACDYQTTFFPKRRQSRLSYSHNIHNFQPQIPCDAILSFPGRYKALWERMRKRITGKQFRMFKYTHLCATYSKFAQLANLSKEGDILLARLLSTDRIVSAQKPHGSAVEGSKTTIV